MTELDINRLESNTHSNHFLDERRIMHALGRQIQCEFYGCNHDLLNDQVRLRDILLEGTRLSGATILSDTVHTFSPHGVSAVIVIAESHVAMHTWPEHGYAAVDIFTCGQTIDPWVIQKYVEQELQPGKVWSMEMQRGVFPEFMAHKQEA
jgi:S-adenosylmethionine decarboxylase